MRICRGWQRPARRLDWPFSDGASVNGSSRLQRNFEFLGAAIGDDGFVQATHKRALRFDRFSKLCLPLGMPAAPHVCQQWPNVAWHAVQLAPLSAHSPTTVRLCGASSVFQHHRPSPHPLCPASQTFSLSSNSTPPSSIHRPSVLILTSSLTSTPLASIHRPSVSFNASSLIPPPRRASQTFSLNLWFP